MKRIIWITILTLTSLSHFANEYAIKVDANGVMRRNDNNQEVSFFGVNYTLPFAHAYRAMGYLGINRKDAIRRDVYHFARLGLNAYRIHIWDVELSDADGNLIENDHLDLLDFLISELENRGISILITGQTNFGNGYPERNINTGAYSYNYDKCQVHNSKDAIKAQKRFLSSLTNHVNPYTGKSYNNDKSIIGYEINNEPCHVGDPENTTKYINEIVKALRSSGCEKPIFYNVSHNKDHVEAYYKSNIQGTTYQWYPSGLVAGHRRRGNFLPNVDNYDIPFNDVKNFNKVSKIVYEFDPADLLYSYMYPATVRTFRKAGFQWITQFAYDPIDMAWANTEYQTHFLNLAYTPSKAISIMIASEVAQNVERGADYGKFPQDTIFGDFRVSYLQDLSEYNSKDKFIYSNNTSAMPKSLSDLKQIAGVGSSQVIKYEGSGAYFLDKISDGVWRLEIMPDVMLTADPFQKPSLDRRIGEIAYRIWDININIPDLGNEYTLTPLNAGNTYKTKAMGGVSRVRPGVYVAMRKGVRSDVKKQDKINYIGMTEYVAPLESAHKFAVQNATDVTCEKDSCVKINAHIFSSLIPDSVKIYPSNVSFWSDNNTLYTMNHTNGYRYEAIIPNEVLNGNDFSYNIVVFKEGKAVTFPEQIDGTPLDWDMDIKTRYTTQIIDSESPIVLFSSDNINDMEMASIPEGAALNMNINKKNPFDLNNAEFSFVPKNDIPSRAFLRKYVGEDIKMRPIKIRNAKSLNIKTEKIIGSKALKVGFVTTDGFSYYADCDAKDGMIKINFSQLKQGTTALIPAPYPVFLERYFTPDISIPFDPAKIDFVEISTPELSNNNVEISLIGIWID